MTGNNESQHNLNIKQCARLFNQFHNFLYSGITEEELIWSTLWKKTVQATNLNEIRVHSVVFLHTFTR